MTVAVEILRERVARYVGDLVGRCETGPEGDVHFDWGSARVSVRCYEYGDEWAVASIEVALLRGLAPSPELFRHVALNAASWHFGTLSLADRGDAGLELRLTHSLLGDYLDVEELKAAVAAVASAADRLDDELAARFGGVRGAGA